MKRATFIIAAFLFATAAHAAEDCTLKEYAELPMTVRANGDLTIPMTLDGQEAAMKLGLSDPYSFLRKSYADARGFPTKPLASVVQHIKLQVHVGGESAETVATVPSFSIGHASGKDYEAVLFDKGDLDDAANGEVALDLLSRFDVELDFANMRLGLYAQDHCEGKVVYWAPSYAAIPFRTDFGLHPMFKMTLDGKTLIVALSSDHGHGRMPMPAATRLFGIDETNASLQPLAADEEGRKLYRYPFKTLAIEGVTIYNPEIDLVAIDDKDECRPVYSHIPASGNFCLGGADLNMGVQEMRQLHLYFAFKEKMLYVTAADAHN